jgi:hypothetical protein
VSGECPDGLPNLSPTLGASLEAASAGKEPSEGFAPISLQRRQRSGTLTPARGISLGIPWEPRLRGVLDVALREGSAPAPGSRPEPGVCRSQGGPASCSTSTSTSVLLPGARRAAGYWSQANVSLERSVERSRERSLERSLERSSSLDLDLYESAGGRPWRVERLLVRLATLRVQSTRSIREDSESLLIS